MLARTISRASTEQVAFDKKPFAQAVATDHFVIQSQPVTDIVDLKNDIKAANALLVKHYLAYLHEHRDFPTMAETLYPAKANRESPLILSLKQYRHYHELFVNPADSPIEFRNSIIILRELLLRARNLNINPGKLSLTQTMSDINRVGQKMLNQLFPDSKVKPSSAFLPAMRVWLKPDQLNEIITVLNQQLNQLPLRRTKKKAIL